MGIYGPLLRERGLLLVDNRGTGTSALIDCRSVQGFAGATSGPEFPGVVAAARAQIERRYRRPGGPPFTPPTCSRPSTPRATSRRSCARSGSGKVDLYGDSYGTFFVQSFISRHQRHLHSVVLDSAYPVRGLDPWYASSGDVARRALDAVCERDAAARPPRPAAPPPGSRRSARAAARRADRRHHPRLRRQPGAPALRHPGARGHGPGRGVGPGHLPRARRLGPSRARRRRRAAAAPRGPVEDLQPRSEHRRLLLERPLLRRQLPGLPAALLDAGLAGGAPRPAGRAPGRTRRRGRSTRSPPASGSR